PTTSICTLSLHDALPICSTWANELRAGYTHYLLQILPNDLTFPYKINTGISNPLLSGIPDVRFPNGPFSQLGAFHNFPKIVGPEDRKSTRLNSSHVAISY